MAYVAANLKLLIPHVGQSGVGLWTLTGTDVHTDADATAFISDGDDKGMRVGDLVLYIKSSATIGATLHSVVTVASGGGATLTPAILA